MRNNFKHIKRRPTPKEQVTTCQETSQKKSVELRMGKWY